MIRALICDLDNTLFSPASLPPDLMRPLIEAMRAQNTGPGAVDNVVLMRAVDEGMRRPFDLVAREHGLPDWVLETWMRENTQLEVRTPLELFPDVDCLWSTSPHRFLVTTGFRRFQDSKVNALGIRHRFEAVFIDAVEEPDRIGKEGVFREILRRWELLPAEVLVLGDSGESEIAVGHRLGMITAQVLRDGIEPAARAHFRITSCEQLPEILAQLQSSA